MADKLKTIQSYSPRLKLSKYISEKMLEGYI